MLDRAAERGALRALHDVGLDGPVLLKKSVIYALCSKHSTWPSAPPGRPSYA